MKEKTYADRQLRLIRRNQNIEIAILLSILFSSMDLDTWIVLLPIGYAIGYYLAVRRYYNEN